MKDLTICMGVYNGEQWLDESVGSVLGQKYGDFDFIILEDCSTDNSLEKLKSFKDDRIKLLPQEKNVGFSHLKMLQAVNTEYVMFIDQDDRFRRDDAFGHSLELIKSNNYDFVNFTCETEVNEDGSTFENRGKLYGDFSYCGDRLFEKFYPADNHYIFHSKIFRTELVKKSAPWSMYGIKGKYTNGDMFYAAMWWFLGRRYLNIATDDPIYEYKNYTGVWGKKRRDCSPERIGKLCLTLYTVMTSLYNRMTAVRGLNTTEISNLINGVNLPMICKLIKGARMHFGDEYGDRLLKVFHAAFCADGVHVFNGLDQFAYPDYVRFLEDMMK